MKTVALDIGRTSLRRLLKEAHGGEVVFLTVRGNTRFVLARADEGDRETCSLRANPRFMAHLSKLEGRARKRPRKTLEQIRAKFGV